MILLAGKLDQVSDENKQANMTYTTCAEFHVLRAHSSSSLAVGSCDTLGSSDDAMVTRVEEKDLLC